MVRKVSVCFLRSQKSICPALLNNIVIYKVTAMPSRHKPVLAPLLWLMFGGSSHKEYYDALVSGAKLSPYTDAFGSQCGTLPRSFPSQPGVVCAASGTCSCSAAFLPCTV